MMTLGEYKKISILLYGPDSKATEFIVNKITDSPNGEEEPVIAAESQMLYLLNDLNKG